MPSDAFDKYLSEINKAYQRGDATEHTHRPALKALIEGLAKKITATNEPKRTACGAPDYVVSRRTNGVDQNFGYIEAKDIGTNLTQAAKTEQIKRYLPGFDNFILTDYIEFRWYVNGKRQLTARLAEESAGKFKATEENETKVHELVEAFLSQKPEKIKIAKELATRMGHKARMMRDIIKKTFQQEEESGTLHGQFEAFREVLLHDLSEEQFADMYAQTICYGLFSARCHIEDMTVFGKDKYAAFHGMDDRAKELTREHAAYLLPKTNPFFRDIFGDIAGPKLDDRIVWLVDDLVELLKQADMGVILRDFARRKKRKDPVVHFYETFIGEYDPKMKKKRGVYYTPDEVVSYIVRSVDILLKEKFGLKRGLADDSKIKGKDLHRLIILDPAVGTGTFLFEVIDQIYKRFRRQKGMWSGYVKEHLLSRIFGFELMMAPYAVAHMKLGLQLAETGYDFTSDERLGIYLTNTLEEAEETTRSLFAQYLSKEAAAANKVKKELPIMVVTGNPPYSYASFNASEWEVFIKPGQKYDTVTKQGKRVEKTAGPSGVRMRYKTFIGRLLKDYYQVDGEPLRERNPKGLQDDYVKFIRFGQWRIEETGAGILAFITNHGYLDNPTFRGMRHQLTKTFSEIYVLDLHGNSKKKETCPDGSADKNVFDIQQGVSIGIFVKQPDKQGPAEVYHYSLWGLRQPKYKWLLENSVESTEWQRIKPRQPFYLFKPEKVKLRKEYENGRKINGVMPINSSCLNTARDALVLDIDKNNLIERIQLFAQWDGPSNDLVKRFKIKNTGWWRFEDAVKELKRTSNWKGLIKQCLYKPFDIRWLFHHESFIDRPRTDVNYHMAQRNLSLITTRQTKENFAVLATDRICGQHKIVAIYDRSYFFPLYLYANPEKEALFEHSRWPRGKNGRVPNLSAEFVGQLAKQIKLAFVSDGVGDLRGTFGPENIFHYIYAVFHSPEYRRRYAEFLKIDFPRVPMPKSEPLFRKLCKVGEKLVKLHLMEAEILEDGKKWPGFDISGDDIVEKGYPKYVAHADAPKKGKVYINKDQYFEGVRPDVWEFHIGGYQVCEKWLKDRRGRQLSYGDISHYQKIVVALRETIRLMKEPCLTEMFEGASSE